MSDVLPQKSATESDVDAVIEKIDAALPMVYQRAEESVRLGRSPSGVFSRAEAEKTRLAFTAMGEDSILTRSGEDIRMGAADAPALLPMRTSARPKSSPPGHRLFYRSSG